jgi:hypothetical protein
MLRDVPEGGRLAMHRPRVVRAAVFSLVAAGIGAIGSACSNKDSGSPTGDAGPGDAALPTTASVAIGPDGGTVAVVGATLTFPAGVVMTPTTITLTRTTDGAPPGFAALSPIYRCDPSGMNFSPPATMSMDFTPDGTTPVMVWSALNDPTFKPIGGTALGTRLTADVAHFSSGFVGHMP